MAYLVGARESRAGLTVAAAAALALAVFWAPAVQAQKGPPPEGGDSAPATGQPVAADSAESYAERREAMLEAWESLAFQVRNATLTEQPAEGYGMFVPRASNSYAPGETIQGYAELLGYRHRETDDGWVFGVTADLRVRSADGEVLFEENDLLRQRMTSAHRNTEFFLNLTYTLNSPPGPYVIETIVRDINSDQETSFEQAVEITAPPAGAAGPAQPVEPSPPTGGLLGQGPGGGQPDVMADPLYGTVNLQAGFTPDPVTVQVAAGGPNQASGLGPGCGGFINAVQPDVRLNFQAGSFPMNIYVVSPADTTLAVNLPNGRWVCNDDASGLNPLVRVQPALSGQYDIWVGTYQQGITPPATVHISELEPRW